MGQRYDTRDARELAKLYYSGSGRTLSVDMAAIAAAGGVVVYTFDMVLLARMVDSHDSPVEWSDLRRRYDNPDAWYIHLLVGSPATATVVYDREASAKYVVFQRGLRNERPHKIPLDRFVERLRAGAVRRWVNREVSP